MTKASDGLSRSTATAAGPSAGTPTATPFRSPLRIWLSARPGRPVAAAAGLLIALQAVFRGWLCYRGWFVGDDFAFIGRARTTPLWSRDYLLKDYGGHFMPGSFLVVRLMNALWPMNFLPVATVDIALQAVTAVVIFKLLRELFSARPAILVPLAVYLFSPITLPAFLWWAAALNQLPQQLAMCTALYLHVRYLRTGRSRYGIVGALAVAGGLLFSEKTLLTVPLIAILTIFYFAGGTPVTRVRSAWRRHWRVWIAYLFVSLPYAGYYVSYVPSPAKGSPPVSGYVDVGINAIGHALLPGLLGGPWHWAPVSSNSAIADPGKPVVWLAVLATMTVVGVSVWLWQRALYAWIVLLGYAVVNVLLLSVARAFAVGALIGSEYRYSTDVCLVAIVCGGFAYLPIAGDFVRAEPQRLLVRPLTRRQLDRLATSDLRGLLPTVDRRFLVALVIGAFLVSSAVSSIRFDTFWRPNAARAYLAAAAHGISTAHRTLTIADVAAPEAVAWALIYPYNLADNMLYHTTPRPTFLTAGASSSELYVPDNSGNLRVADVFGVTNRPGPDQPCGWTIGRAPIVIPLEQPTGLWSWVVRIGYISNTDGRTTVSAGRVTTNVTIMKGLHALYVMGSGPTGAVRVGALDGDGHMCTDEIRAGSPVPVPGSHP